jgi:hypothetical protein
LALYFENPQYAINAMYVTLYGESNYIKQLIGKTIGDKVLHHSDTFLHNTHLHVRGVERGTQQYGGYGLGASSLSINGQVIAKPTLPQRDIFAWVAEPILEKIKKGEFAFDALHYSQFEYKNVEKLLRLKTQKAEPWLAVSVPRISLTENVES